jgi:23S rRNA (uracil1939-C5)-methyltransferase
MMNDLPEEGRRMSQEDSGVIPLKKGQDAVLRVDQAAFEGRAVARYGGLVVFVDGAAPGDLVRVCITTKKKNYAEARTLEVLEPSPDRVEPPCMHFGHCGGCSWQYLRYESQCAWKRRQVLDAFERLGGFHGITIEETRPSPDVLYYRNKMEFSFGARRWLLPEELGKVDREDEPFALGLHVRGRFDRLLDVNECLLQSPASNLVLNATRSFFRERGLQVYDTDERTGTLRYLVVREAKITGQRMVFLVTADIDKTIVSEYGEMLQGLGIEITTFVHGISRKRATIAVADEERTIFGPGAITENLLGVLFRISPSSFFQTNSRQTERLFSHVFETGMLTKTDHVWDLYCGTGAISLIIAGHVGSVLGVELNEAAVEDAANNAVLNGIGNAQFIAADCLRFLADPPSGMTLPDVIILDPPRAGLHPDAVTRVAAFHPPRILYISCNPATCARDCRVLCDNGYEIRSITPFDMFPMTFHIECVVELVRKES